MVACVYSFRTGLLVTNAGSTGQKEDIRGDTETPLAQLSVCNGLNSQALDERFYMGTPKAN